MNVVVIGATGGIGSALTDLYSGDSSNRVHALGRRRPEFLQTNVNSIVIDFQDESTLARAAENCASTGDIDIVVNAVGILHGDSVHPEKSLQDISQRTLAAYHFANCTCAALALKHFAPRLARRRRAVFASLSARLGSITDNRRGGWYGYRASKAAHNMIVKTAGIEIARTRKHAVVIGIHPGTVDTGLSQPFSKNVPASQLFDPRDAAQRILALIQRIEPADSGKVFAYDGKKVPA